METPHVGTGNGSGSRATQFKAGWKGGPGRPRTSESEVPASPLIPLEDMRHVYNCPASKDRTPGQKGCRRFFEEDYKGFVALYMKLEKAHLSAVATVAIPKPAAALAPGEKELRVEEMIEQLFAGWEEEEKRNGIR